MEYKILDFPHYKIAATVINFTKYFLACLEFVASQLNDAEGIFAFEQRADRSHIYLSPQRSPLHKT